ncbi:dUTP diphosphatase [Neobacillus drentensis]|uniref:dUTP diphosphatase n=1 Tax=Neobacillus drentensis TaxID=220684 RepID=UPI002FFE036F
MNLEKLFQAQKVLRDRIGYNEPDRLNKLILALLVELGECANEWRGFKFWSKDQAPRTRKARGPYVDLEDAEFYNPLLEEYVDGLHFVLELGLEINPKDFPIVDVEPLTGEFKSVIEAIRHTFNWTVNLDYILFDEPFKSDYRIQRTYFNLLQVFITLGEMLGFTWEEVEQAYYAKNSINHQRQEDGY